MGLLTPLFITLLLVFYPLMEITRIPIGDAAVTFIDFAVVFISFIWIVKKTIERKKPKGILIKPISFFIAILFLSLLINFNKLTLPQFFVSFLYFVRWIAYAVIYLVVKDLDVNFKKYLPFLLKISGTLVMIIGFFLYFFYPDLRNLRYLGWDEHLYRNFSSFLDPNFAGIFYVLYFVLISDSFNFKKIKSKWQIINLVLIILSIMSVLTTFSRSAYIAFVIAVLSFVVLKKEIKFLLFILVFSIGLFLLPSFSLKSEGTNLMRTASGKARIDSIKNALTIFKDSPILGVGFDSYRYAQRRYGFINESKMLIHSAAGTDNSFLFVLATSGLIGFFSFVYLLYNLFKFSLSSTVLLISLIALCVDSLFLNSLFYSPLMLWMWILFGLKENSRSRSLTENS